MEYRFTVTISADNIGEAWAAMSEIHGICQHYGMTEWKDAK